MSRHLRLDDGTTWPDPVAVAEAFERLPTPPGYLRPLDEPRTDAEREAFADYCTLRAAMEAYDHLARHPAGTESAVGSLRSLRRAVVKRGME